MRIVLLGGISSALITAAAIVGLRAADATLTVAAVAAVTALIAWLAALHTTEEASGLGATSPLAAVALGVVGRAPWAGFLPLLAAQAVAAVAVGAGAAALDSELGPTLVTADPGLVTAGVVGALVGLVSAWVVLAVDGGGPAALTVVPPVLAGAGGPVGLVLAFHPAALAGLATAGVLPWDAVGVAAGAGLVAAAAASWAITWVVPADQ